MKMLLDLADIESAFLPELQVIANLNVRLPVLSLVCMLHFALKFSITDTELTGWPDVHVILRSWSQCTTDTT